MTHATTYLPEFDYIIVMKNGRITEYGPYSELMARQGDFSDFIITYCQEEQNVRKVNNICKSKSDKKFIMVF